MPGLFLLLVAASAGQVAAPAQTCRSSRNEIVVCGTRPGESPYRMPKIAKDYRAKPLKAQAQLAPGLSADAHVESEEIGGAISKRAMVGLKLRF